MISKPGMHMIINTGQQNISSIKNEISSTSISEKGSMLRQSKKFKNFFEQKKNSRRK
jgi:hypothetical protein